MKFMEDYERKIAEEESEDNNKDEDYSQPKDGDPPAPKKKKITKRPKKTSVVDSESKVQLFILNPPTTIEESNSPNTHRNY